MAQTDEKCVAGKPTDHKGKTRARPLLVRQGLRACVRLCLAVPLPGRDTQTDTEQETQTDTETDTDRHGDTDTHDRHRHRHRHTHTDLNQNVRAVNGDLRNKQTDKRLTREPQKCRKRDTQKALVDRSAIMNVVSAYVLCCVCAQIFFVVLAHYA